MKTQVELNCQNCSKTYFANPSKVNSKNGSKFCSMTCVYSYLRNKPKKKKEFVCKACGNVFFDLPSVRRVFCSKECSTKNMHKRIATGSFICVGCGVNFKDSPSKTRLYCTKECYHQNQCGSGFNKYSKRFKQNYLGLRNLNKFCCKCNSENNVHVHHVDGNHSNDKTSNLIFLCQLCHRELHNIYDQSKKSLKHLTLYFIKKPKK